MSKKLKKYIRKNMLTILINKFNAIDKEEIPLELFMDTKETLVFILSLYLMIYLNHLVS
ncbi:hypothetical protein ACT3HK_10385 [Thermolongibacillus altinsuensis]